MKTYRVTTAMGAPLGYYATRRRAVKAAVDRIMTGEDRSVMVYERAGTDAWSSLAQVDLNGGRPRAYWYASRSWEILSPSDGEADQPPPYVEDAEGAPVSAGSRVVIVTLFPPAVPSHLVGTLATVERITRNRRLVLRADVDAYGTRTVDPGFVSARRAALLTKGADR